MSRKIKIQHNEINAFAMVAEKCPFNVYLINNGCKTNAKNLSDVSLMDFTQILGLEYDGYDAFFEMYLAKKCTMVCG